MIVMESTSQKLQVMGTLCMYIHVTRSRQDALFTFRIFSVFLHPSTVYIFNMYTVTKEDAYESFCVRQSM